MPRSAYDLSTPQIVFATVEVKHFHVDQEHLNNWMMYWQYSVVSWVRLIIIVHEWKVGTNIQSYKLT